MKILQVHNFYQRPGGEDQVLSAERDMLIEHGETVEQYLVHNEAIQHMTGIDIGLRTIWNPDTTRSLEKRLTETRPEIIHVHNTFPLISPAVYYAAHSRGVPLVQTLHNFRLICPARQSSHTRPLPGLHAFSRRPGVRGLPGRAASLSGGDAWLLSR